MPHKRAAALRGQSESDLSWSLEPGAWSLEPSLLVHLFFQLGERIVDRSLVLELAQLALSVGIAAILGAQLLVHLGLRLELLDAVRHALEVRECAGARRHL